MSPFDPLTDTTHLRLPDHVLTRTVGDETILLDLESEQYFGLDDVGARFLALMQDGATFATALSELRREYDVDAEILRADLDALVSELREIGLVEASDAA